MSRRLQVSIAIVVLLIVLALAARPAYRAFRENRIQRLIESAEEAARLEDWQAARERSRTVLLMKRGEYRAFAIQTRALAKMEDPAAAIAAISLIRHPEATREDQVGALEILASQGPVALAIGAYAHLDKKNPTKLQDVELNAAISPLLLTMGPDGLAAVRKCLVEHMPEKPSPRVRLAFIRTVSVDPDPRGVPLARKHFAALIEEGAPEALTALELLGSTAGGLAPGEPLPNLPNWVSRQAGAKVIHHLLALHPQLAENPKGSEAIFTAAVNRFAPLDPAETANWLNRHNRPEEALKVLEEPAKHRSDAYLARIRALLRLRRDDELLAALASPPENADLVEVEIVRAVLAKYQKDKAAAKAAWGEALKQATYDTQHNRFISIAKAAELCGDQEAAAEAWTGAVSLGFGRIPLYSNLTGPVVYLYQKENIEALFKFCQNLAPFEPGNADLINNLLYIGLIKGDTKPADVTERLEKILAESPGKVELNSTLAIADLLAGNAEKARARLSAPGACDKMSPVTKTLLEAAILKMTGDEAKADEIYQKTDKSKLMSAEQALYEILIQGKKDDKSVETSLADLLAKKMMVDPAEVPAWQKGLERAEQKPNSADVAGKSYPELRVPGVDNPLQPFDVKEVPE